jgi:transposase-like protein
VDTLNIRCPHCEGPLVLQRAAPGDAHFRIVCTDCGASARSSGDALEHVALPKPAAFSPITRPGKV